MRKIVQIAIAGYVSTADEQGNPSLVALCDDGTVWIKRAWSGTIWYRQPDIPQEPVVQPENYTRDDGWLSA